MGRLRGLWSLVDARPRIVVGTKGFSERVDAPAERVLRRLRVVRSGPNAVRWPCDEPACAREVVENAEAAGRPFVAVCSRASAGCEPIELAASDVEQIEIVRAELIRALARAYELREVARGAPTARALDAAEPILLGVDERGGDARDVFLGSSRDAGSTGRWLALRERASRPALLLVPTADRVPPEALVRHGRGAHVEVEILEDTVGVEHGELVRTKPKPALRVVASDEAPEASSEVARVAKAPTSRAATKKEPRSPLLDLPQAKSWSEITFYRIDGTTLRVQVGAKSKRYSHTDLRMASEQNRKPLKQFYLLAAFCEHDGRFVWGDGRHGKEEIDAVKQLMTELRKTLKALFGLESDPFHPYSRGGWRPRFVAKSRLPTTMFDDDD